MTESLTVSIKSLVENGLDLAYFSVTIHPEIGLSKT